MGEPAEQLPLSPAHHPIFLVGSERSGTTMLRLMLDSHPAISFAAEFEFLVDQMGADGSRPELHDYHRYLSTSRIFESSGLRVDPSLGYDDLVRGFLEAQVGDADMVGATVHYRFDQLPELWPNARFIHIVRDPRDVAPSCIKMGWAGNVWFGLDKWIESEEDWARFAPSVSPNRIFEVRFEVLVADHEATLGRLCSWLGVPWTEEMIGYTEWTDYEPPTSSAAGRWSVTQSDDDVRLMEARLGNLLERSGYEPSGLPAMDVDADRLAALARQDRRHRIRFRRERFGLALVLAEMATRPIGPTAIRTRVLQRMNAIEMRTLKKSWR